MAGSGDKISRDAQDEAWRRIALAGQPRKDFEQGDRQDYHPRNHSPSGRLCDRAFRRRRSHCVDAAVSLRGGRRVVGIAGGTLNGREENQRMIATETPEECAARELSEETGYEAEVLEKVCECYAMPGISDE